MDFLKRYSIYFSCVALTLVFVILGAVSNPWWYTLLILFVPLSILGSLNIFQNTHTLLRNYPVLAYFRWLSQDLRPFLRQYIVESDLEGKPFSIEERATVYARSKGEEGYQPFGTETNTYSDEHEWIPHSINPCPVPEGDVRVTIGNSQCKLPYSASILNISAMSFGSIGANAIEALNIGAKKGGFYHDTGEGGISPYHLKHGGDLVWEFGTGYFGCRDNKGRFDKAQFQDKAQNDQIKMIEIKLSQGAKPGHGGILPGVKVSPEIAQTRGIEEGVDCISPSYHTAFSTPIELLEFVQHLRELSGGKPVGIKLCVGMPHEVFAIVKAMLHTGIYLDYIVVDGAEGGTGAAPQEFSDHIGMPLREGLIIVRNAIEGANLREHVKIAASGKVSTAFAIAANCAIGADWCNSARAFMFALGCVMSMRCHTDQCPTGITTQDPLRQRGLVIPTKALRVEKYHAKTIHMLKQILAGAGIKHPSELRPTHLYHRISAVEAKTIDHIYTFLQPGCLLEGDLNKTYTLWWNRAQADSFMRAED